MYITNQDETAVQLFTSMTKHTKDNLFFVIIALFSTYDLSMD